MEFKENEREALEAKVHRSALFQRVFSGAEGEEALKLLDNWAGYKSDTFKKENIHESVYLAGRRSVAIFLHNALDGDVEQAKKMLGEKND